MLKPLYAAHAAIKIERERRDPLDLDLPERKLVLDREGRLNGVRWPERLEAHRLIEEFMILANVAAAETLEAAQSPLLYRAHDAPSVEKLNDLVEFLGTIGVKLAKGERVRPSHFNGVLAASRARRSRRWSTRSCCAPRRRPNTATRTTAISASTCAATPISPRRSAATPTSSCIAR